MRFAKFTGLHDGLEIWLDIDRILIVEGRTDGGSNIHYVEDNIIKIIDAPSVVMAVLQPAAAPDTFEEELRAPPADGLCAVDRAARLDELTRTARMILGGEPAYWPTWAKEILGKRVAELEGKA